MNTAFGGLIRGNELKAALLSGAVIASIRMQYRSDARSGKRVQTKPNDALFLYVHTTAATHPQPSLIARYAVGYNSTKPLTTKQ